MNRLLKLKPLLSLHRRTSTSIRIGDVSIKSRESPSGFVPLKYLPGDKGSLPQKTLDDLRWIMQKDILGQDVFLIGRPGSHRRRLIMQYLELVNGEAEYVSLSRDTTESDLKQRREISSGTAKYIDQCAVDAARKGRFLVLDGIEKAERNVLPVLNNLLENREMQLEDGRLLISAGRYDELLKSHSVEELDKLKLVRVSEDFRVIALGLPVPTYVGHPLDPPLRSRFQARDVHQYGYQEQLESFGSRHPSFAQVLSFAHTLMSDEVSSVGLPDIPLENMEYVSQILSHAPSSNAHDLIQRIYPYDILLPKDLQGHVSETLSTFGIESKASSRYKDTIEEVNIESDRNRGKVKVGHESFEVSVGNSRGGKSKDDLGFVSIPYHEDLLSKMMLSHSVGDFCVVGPKGCGKSIVVQRFAELLHYDIEPIMLYQDMTSRDILQQRSTLENGDTIWKMSPLIEAALSGKIAVLDGIHKIHRGSIGILQRLSHDREVQLYDGSRLLRSDRYDALLKKLGQEAMNEAKLMRIHPSFRMIALAENPSTGNQWLCPEMLSTFLYHSMRPLNYSEELKVLESLTGSPSQSNILDVLQFAHGLRSSDDASLQSIANSISSRQIIRIARRLEKFDNEGAFEAIQKTCLSEFLPALPKEMLLKSLSEYNLRPSSTYSDSEAICRVTDDGTLRIGKTSTPIYKPESQTKVPQTLFYETPQNVRVLEALLQDFLLGEHLLLVGNQGVGKNKVVDHLLSLLNRPREYIQLHRDTTVQSLTVSPSVKDGVIVYEDSPLVKAVKSGFVLVVDEADKAPTHVTCVLKTLIESGEMILSDGRRISKAGRGNDIQLHPDFRTIVLANRPGFPFLGNDFFGSMGDLFSSHAILNPSVDAEMSMLKRYGPSVPQNTLQKFVEIFSELRSLADEGSIQYPYSTREVVNIIKHLEAFPEDGLSSVVRNVFDFDSYDKDTRDTLEDVLQKHGIPISNESKLIRLSPLVTLPYKHRLIGSWQTHSLNDVSPIQLSSKDVSVEGPFELTPFKAPLDIVVESRGQGFSELNSYKVLPYHENAMTADVAVQRDQNDSLLNDVVHVLTKNPYWLYSNRLGDKDNLVRRNLNPYFKGASSHLHKIQIMPLKSGLLAIHNESDPDSLLLVNPETNNLFKLKLSNLYDSIKKSFQGRNNAPSSRILIKSHERDDDDLRFLVEGNKLEILKNTSSNCPTLFSYPLPFDISSVHFLGDERYLMVSLEGDNFIFNENGSLDQLSSENEIKNIDHAKFTLFSPDDKSYVEEAKSKAQHTLLTSKNSYAVLLKDLGNPSNSEGNEVLDWPRPTALKNKKLNKSLFLPRSGQVITQVSAGDVPKSYPINDDSISDYLEVIDLSIDKMRFLPLPRTSHPISSVDWYRRTYQQSDLKICPTSNEGFITLDLRGTLRLWETGLANLKRSLEDWKRMVGAGNRHQLTISKDEVGDLSSPKHGKVDLNNDPHVGGNTWAGGTGGRDTAGLGGIGGPYRLDAGHDVHQLSDDIKDSVPEHIRAAARDMNRKAYEEKLREIRMSPYEADLYERYSSGVAKQVTSLKAIISGLQAKAQDRQWLKHQTSGELDDTRLIEGITGEKSIYKKRAEIDPEPGSVQEKPKKLRLLLDVSGSMYRFNGHDQRLERSMESALMVMESLQGFESKIIYDIYGHSGEERGLPFVSGEADLPANNKERLDVLKNMVAHSQFCFTGDNTLPGTVSSINELTSEANKYDENILIVMSDANFDRYGISPDRFAKILRESETVSTYAIFIGSLGDQARVLAKKLPSGKAFVCMDTKKIPEILKTIFTSTMLK